MTNPKGTRSLYSLIILVALLLAIVWLASRRGSGRSGDSTLPRVVILQDKPQEWADAMKLGFYDGLNEAGQTIGRDMIVSMKSAAGESASLTAVAEGLSRDGSDVVFTLGTQASQSYFEALLDPQRAMVFGAVTDPVAAGFYENDLDHPRKNLTGTQDLWPYDAQFALFRRLVPEAKRIGTIYNSGEVNSQISIKLAREAAELSGFQLIEKTVSSDREIEIAVAALLAEKMDALYIPADNTAQGASSVIIEMAAQNGTPVFTGIAGIVENGAVATVGTDYYEVGKVNGKQVAEIIDGKRAATIPVGVATRGDIYINERVAKELQITIPADIKAQAVKIYS